MTVTEASEFSDIRISKVSPNPFQPRESIGDISDLTESIRSAGVLSPIMVRPNGDGFQIAYGERRWRAAKEAGLETVPAIIRDIEDRGMRLYALVENIHRSDLRDKEKERAIYELWKNEYEPAGKSRRDLDRDLGWSDNYVSKIVSAHEDRGRGPLPSEATTDDIGKTKGLDSRTRQELLTAKVSGEVGSRETAEIASAAKQTKDPEKQRIIVSEMLREARKAKEYMEAVREDAEDFAKREEPRIEIRRGPNENRLHKLLEARKFVRGRFTIAYFEMLQGDYRWKAVDLLRETRDYCNGVLHQMEQRPWFKEERDGKD